MLNLHRPKQVSDHIGIDLKEIESLCDELRAGKNASKYCEEMICCESGNSNATQRPVLVIKNKFRRVQRRIYKRLLLPRYTASEYSHGGIPGRSIKSNAMRHSKSTFGLVIDVSKFYPSISHHRVYSVFESIFGCHADAARILTRLTTYNFHLALGLVTSPLLADAFMRDIDQRLARLCDDRNAIYTRYVDDITVTAQYSLDPLESGLYAKMEEIFDSIGFSLNEKKTNYGRLSDGLNITGLRFSPSGRINVQKNYLVELSRRLDAAHSLSKDGEFQGPYYTSDQIYGQIKFVHWINPPEARPLLRRFRDISWARVHRNASSRELVKNKKILIPKLRSDWKE